MNISPEIAAEVKKFPSSEALLRGGGISIDALDRQAFGFSESDIKTLMPNQLKIKWHDDLENVLWEVQKSGQTKRQWAEAIDLSEPIEVSFEKNKFYIEDGHHRYYAAKVLNKPLNVVLDIKTNPIQVLAPKVSYDDFHRQVFDQVKNTGISENTNEGVGNDFNSKIFYHGRTNRSPYIGKYIYLTDDIGYASGYSKGDIMKFTIPFSEDKLFSIKNPKHLQALSKYIDSLTIKNIIRDSGVGSEIDWAVLSYISTDDYEEAEDLFQHMGFYGIKLKERPETDSIYIFDESTLNYIGSVNMYDDKKTNKAVGDYHTNYIKKYISEIISEEIGSNSSVDDFYSRNNIDPEELDYLGSGDFGKAYSTGDGRVLKITRSKSEFDIAKSLLGKNDIGVLDGIVDIYVSEIVGGEMMIIMEELSEDSDIENLYYELDDLLSQQSLPIQYLHYLDTDELEISDELRSFMSDIEDINSGYRYLGIEASDVKPDNMGRDKNGKIKAFDLDDRSLNEVNKIISEEINDYQGEHKAPSKNDSPLYDPTQAYGEDIYTNDALRFFGNGNSYDSYSLAVIRSVKGRPNRQVKIYRAVPDFNYEIDKKLSYYRGLINYVDRFGFTPIKDRDASDIHSSLGYDKNKTLDYLYSKIRELSIEKQKSIGINAGDWVTIAPEYAKEHGRNNLKRFKVAVKTVPASSLYTDGNDLNEWGYQP